jgi:membrane-associated protein
MLVARFMPFMRTFAPFVAGVGGMSYPRYFAFDLAGALLWVFSLCLAGYWFGNLPWVKANLSILIIFATIGLSLPAAVPRLAFAPPLGAPRGFPDGA